MPVPARPSRNVLMTGIAAPTAASKFSAPPCFSAAFASLMPCFASSALLAVTTDLPAFSAASTADSAAHHPEQRENQADDHQDDADRP